MRWVAGGLSWLAGYAHRSKSRRSVCEGNNPRGNKLSTLLVPAGSAPPPPAAAASNTRFPQPVGLMSPHGDRNEADNSPVAHAMIFIIMA